MNAEDSVVAVKNVYSSKYGTGPIFAGPVPPILNMSSEADNFRDKPTQWQPIWRRPYLDIAEPLMDQVPGMRDTLRSIFKLRSIQDLCKLVGFSYRLSESGEQELFDPAAAVERLERYRTCPTPESAALAQAAIIQFVRALPDNRTNVQAWETAFVKRNMADFLPDYLESNRHL